MPRSREGEEVDGIGRFMVIRNAYEYDISQSVG